MDNRQAVLAVGFAFERKATGLVRIGVGLDNRIFGNEFIDREVDLAQGNTGIRGRTTVDHRDNAVSRFATRTASSLAGHVRAGT